MAPHNEEDDPAVYRAGTYKKSDVLQNGGKKATNGTAEGHKNKEASSSSPAATNGVNGTNGHGPASSNGHGNGHGNGNGNGKHKRSSQSPSSSPRSDGVDPEDGMEVDEGEEDSTLLTVQPGFNRLLLVLRDERVMRFVKYVSAAAEGSRWDVCAEFEVGMVQEDNEDDE
ncbi:hypothetical protein GYMLUDRAFT_36325 [Collybiopsis luxurians FD-317 M1]|nr:hypothetical protein GYMLUDRAFT_36325 [Collybiopsis luxurians FD-317 M1]